MVGKIVKKYKVVCNEDCSKRKLEEVELKEKHGERGGKMVATTERGGVKEMYCEEKKKWVPCDNDQEILMLSKTLFSTTSKDSKKLISITNRLLDICISNM